MTDMTLYFSPAQPESYDRFCRALRQMTAQAAQRPIVFLCIGSDRATGDSLGPMIGQQLETLSTRFESHKKTAVYGNLRHTVHAGNLADTLSQIHRCFLNPFIIAIDASLGVPEHVGCVTLGTGGLRPGIGVSRNLPIAGDIHITGIVNHSGANNHLTLQTTRLCTVTELASFISQGILDTLHVCPSLKRPQKSHFINIFQIPSYRHTAGNPADLNPRRLH